MTQLLSFKGGITYISFYITGDGINLKLIGVVLFAQKLLNLKKVSMFHKSGRVLSNMEGG